METNAELFSQYISYMLRRTPMLLVSLTGIVLAIIKWRKHSRVSLFLILGFSLYIFSALFFTAVNNWLYPVLSKRNFNPNSIEWFYFATNILQNSTWALMLALIIAAIFSQRDFTNQTA